MAKASKVWIKSEDAKKQRKEFQKQQKEFQKEQKLTKDFNIKQQQPYKLVAPKNEDDLCSTYEYLTRMRKADTLLDKNRKGGTFPSQMMYIQVWKNDGKSKEKNNDDKKVEEPKKEKLVDVIPEPAAVDFIDPDDVPNKYAKADTTFIQYAGKSADGSTIVVKAITNPNDRSELDKDYKKTNGQFHTERMILAMSNDVAPLKGNYEGGIAIIMSTYSPCYRCDEWDLIKKICAKIKASKCIYFYGKIWEKLANLDAPATKNEFYTKKQIDKNIPVYQCYKSIINLGKQDATPKKKDTKDDKTKDDKTKAMAEYHDIYSGHYMNGLSHQENNKNSKALTMATDLFAGYGFDQYDGNTAYYQSKQDGSTLAGNLIHGEASSYGKSGNDFMESFSFGFICGILYMALLCCVVVILAYILGRAWNKMKRVFDSEQGMDKESDGSEFEV